MSNFDFIGSFLGKRAQLKKDGHDMSSFEAMSAPFGVFTPVACYDVVPNEHYEGNISVTVQTAPMREDNFARLYHNLKAVFVPLDSICRDYLSLTESARTTRKDCLFDFKALQPVTNLGRILFNLHFFYHLQKCREELVAYVPQYFDYFYNPDLNTFVDSSGNDIFDKIPVTAKHARNLITWLLSLTITSSGDQWRVINGLDNFTGLSSEFLVTSALRLLDQYGFGNYIPLFETLSDRYSSVVLSLISDISGISDDYDNSFTDNIDAQVVAYIHAFRAAPINRNVDLFPLFAWQYYINLCEVSNYRQASVPLISYDSVLSLVEHGDQLFSEIRFDHSMEIWPFDNSQSDLYYLVNSLIGEFLHQIVSYGVIEDVDHLGHLYVEDLNDRLLFMYLFGSHSPLLDQDVFNTSQLSAVEGSIPTVTTTELQNNIVKAYAETSALYSLRQDLLRAGVRRDKQMEAIFGVSDRSALYEGVQILDMSKTPLNIQGLLNQAETEVAPLGDRAARGNGGNSLHFKFDSKDFGFIFIFQYYTAEMFYENFMIDRQRTLDSKGWFNPKFNHLGLESILSQQLSFMNIAGADNESLPVVNQTSVVGLSAHDWHLKQRVNKVHGLFTNFAFPFDTDDRSHSYYAPTSLMRGNALFGGFCPSLIDQQVDLYSRRADLYYNPYMVNNLFAQLPGSGLHNDQSFDFFRCAFTLNVRKVSPMPKLGLFRFDV